MKTNRLLCIALCAASVAIATAQSPVPALTIAGSQASNSGNFVVGYRFTLEKPMKVTALGIFDQNMDGQLNASESVPVAIWDESGAEVASVEVVPGTPVEEGAFYAQIEPVALAAGTYVIGALTHLDEERFFYDSSIETAPGVKWVEGRYANGTVLAIPNLVNDREVAYFGPVFKVVSDSALQAAAQTELRILQPAERAIFQRNGEGRGSVPIEIALSGKAADTVEVRAIHRTSQVSASDWIKVAGKAQLDLPGGWYQLDFRALKDGGEVAAAKVEHVGVGEVFVTCGQSNSANHGSPPQKAQDERVSSCDFKTGKWRHGDDPQPGASGGGGSPWALLGDLLVKKTGVPVGFVSVGVGSTAVQFWTPAGEGYSRLKQALDIVGRNGCRAVLWHQGESDSKQGTPAEKYAEMLGATIAQSRKDAGWNVPWGVAVASFIPAPEATDEKQAAVAEGQKMVAATVPGVFQGPTTDGFRERGFLHDNVHFNAQGLAAHAQGWADVLTMIPGSESQSEPK